MAPISSIETDHSVLSYTTAEHSTACEATTKFVPLILLSTEDTKKSVSFNPLVQALRTLHVIDYSDEELRSTWHTALDYDRIKRENKTTIRLMMSDHGGGSPSLVDSLRYCPRGLEASTREGSNKRWLNKLKSRSAVIDELELQNAEGQCDPELLADIYFDSARHCQDEAHEKALIDQVYAQQVGEPYDVKNHDLSLQSRRSELVRLRRVRTVISTAAA
jgi:hypothetical protein